MDDHSHGTHTAGTIGAVGNNGVGVAGVNWNVRILACKAFNASGSGTDSAAIECFKYITALKNKGINIRVSSNSWGSTRQGGVPFIDEKCNRRGCGSGHLERLRRWQLQCKQRYDAVRSGKHRFPGNGIGCRV